MKKAIITVAAAIGISAGILGCIRLYASNAPETSEASADAPAINAPSRYISQDDFIRTAEATVNGVVSVKSYATPRRGNGADIYGGDIFDFFSAIRASAVRCRANQRSRASSSSASARA